MSWLSTFISSQRTDSTNDASRRIDDPLLEENLEAWKHVVSVQQHFNEIGWKIRGLAITALTFILGATFFGFLNAGLTRIGRFEFNPSAIVPVIGLMIWLLFWFADGIWYHRLLGGAGKAASRIETHLVAHGIHAGLSDAITEASHKKWLWMESTSTKKLHTFYTFGSIILLGTAVAVFLMGSS